MGNRSCNQQVHHHPSTGNGNTTSPRYRNTFFPMLCRLSINDVAKPTRLADLTSSSSTSTSCSPDPTSPKISCIGRIKKRSNSNSTSTSTANHHISASRISTATPGKSATNLNYNKLRKLFSGKNLISPPTDTATISNHCGIRSCNGNGGVKKPSKQKKYMISIGDPEVAVEELDPPLPVVKCRPRDQQVNVNLGKRRGIELKILQIQPFQLSTVHGTKFINNRDISADNKFLR
ncbi:unnamed protein product [Lactuca saligna]|uniref:Uncharacterized protein n=1 Tax=Lactuca saligna TaxID=75948 RepID=A0AA35Y925_LACSI|nr:unnamed protein product [Lactuca saligna]